MQVNDFKYACIYKVLVASYETLRNHTADLTGFCDLLVCDEGHRLKASRGSKTMDALLALACRRRILLTGTPLQNNLDEFYGRDWEAHAFSGFSPPWIRRQDAWIVIAGHQRVGACIEIRAACLKSRTQTWSKNICCEELLAAFGTAQLFQGLLQPLLEPLTLLPKCSADVVREPRRPGQPSQLQNRIRGAR